MSAAGGRVGVVASPTRLCAAVAAGGAPVLCATASPAASWQQPRQAGHGWWELGAATAAGLFDHCRATLCPLSAPQPPPPPHTPPCSKSKLYRFDNENNEWKERGVGQARLLQHKGNKKIRFLMRQDKTLKIRANHIGGCSGCKQAARRRLACMRGGVGGWVVCVCVAHAAGQDAQCRANHIDGCWVGGWVTTHKILADDIAGCWLGGWVGGCWVGGWRAVGGGLHGAVVDVVGRGARHGLSSHVRWVQRCRVGAAEGFGGVSGSVLEV